MASKKNVSNKSSKTDSQKMPETVASGPAVKPVAAAVIVPVAAAVTTAGPAAAVTTAGPVAAAALATQSPAGVTGPVAAAATPVRVEAGRDRSAIVALIGKLRGADADVSRDAAVTLGTLPADAEAIDALCEVVRNSDGYFHSVVRAAAATTLGKLGDRRAVEALIAATGDSMAEASEEAVKALGLLGDVRAAAALRAIEKNASGFYLEPVRKTAAEALRKLKA